MLGGTVVYDPRSAQSPGCGRIPRIHPRREGSVVWLAMMYYDDPLGYDKPRDRLTHISSDHIRIAWYTSIARLVEPVRPRGRSHGAPMGLLKVNPVPAEVGDFQRRFHHASPTDDEGTYGDCHLVSAW